MTTLSRLVTAVADAQGMDNERVSAIARALREDGFIQMLGRGTSAAQMNERDAANLLIATNTADTARTASAAVKQFRELRVDRKANEFGAELEEMISAAKRECIADYLSKVARHTARGPVVGKRNYVDGFRLQIEFEKPVPNVLVIVSTRAGNGSTISFSELRSTIKATGDRRVRSMITERTILAVAAALRT
jgi:hypothetical protein